MFVVNPYVNSFIFLNPFHIHRQVSPTGNLPPPPWADNGAGLSSTLGKYYKAADLGRPVRNARMKYMNTKRN